jgi:hypothetical protein
MSLLPVHFLTITITTTVSDLTTKGAFHHAVPILFQLEAVGAHFVVSMSCFKTLSETFLSRLARFSSYFSEVK